VAVNGLVILMIPGYLTDMIKGIILLLAVMLSRSLGKFVKSRQEERIGLLLGDQTEKGSTSTS
jgi:ribose/xylose/arabinose/galactoside ABC-type transport system permease subunit